MNETSSIGPSPALWVCVPSSARLGGVWFSKNGIWSGPDRSVWSRSRYSAVRFRNPSPTPNPALTEANKVSPSLTLRPVGSKSVRFWPQLAVASPPSAASFSTTLMTPAIASDPYCAPAPSRSTSIRLMAPTGMLLKSTGLVPLPSFDSVVSVAVPCRRLPFTSTSTWSGLRFRSCAGRTRSAKLEFDWRGRLNEGTSDWIAAPISPGIDAARRMDSCGSRSIGARLSSTLWPAVRVPTTTTSSSAGWSSAASASPAMKRPIPEAPTPSTDRTADRNPLTMTPTPEEFFLRNQSMSVEIAGSTTNLDAPLGA